MNKIKNLFIKRNFIFTFGLLISSQISNPNQLKASLGDKLIAQINIQESKSLSIKSEYIVGSGDILYIDFEGINVYSGEYIVNPNGYLILPEIKNYYAMCK